MVNFLEETKEAISDSGHTPEDIVYIGEVGCSQCTWEEFCSIADFEYVCDFAGIEVGLWVTFVFTDGVKLIRARDHYGRSWWEDVAPVDKTIKLFQLTQRDLFEDDRDYEQTIIYGLTDG